MKQLSEIKNYLRSFFALLTLSFIQSIAWAQEKKLDVDVDVNKDGGNWYTQPWVWIVGGAVFLLLLVALLRGGKKD